MRRFGLPSSISMFLSAPLAETVRNLLPKVKLRVVEAMSGFIRKWLQDETIDLGFLGVDADFHIWKLVRLTLELAMITTLALLVVATPLSWGLARSRRHGRRSTARSCSFRWFCFYLLIALGPSGPGGWIAGLWGDRTLAFTFWGLVIGSIVASMPFGVQPIRNLLVREPLIGWQGKSKNGTRGPRRAAVWVP